MKRNDKIGVVYYWLWLFNN